MFLQNSFDSFDQRSFSGIAVVAVLGVRGPITSDGQVQLFVLLLNLPVNGESSGLSRVLSDVNEDFLDFRLNGLFADSVLSDLVEGFDDCLEHVVFASEV